MSQFAKTARIRKRAFEKRTENVWKNAPTILGRSDEKTLRCSHPLSEPFGINFSSILTPFLLQFRSQNLKKCLPEPTLRIHQFLERFFEDFGSLLGHPKMKSYSSRGTQKMLTSLFSFKNRYLDVSGIVFA